MHADLVRGTRLRAPVRWLGAGRPMPDRQHDVYGVEAISTGVLVLSYTEFVRQPAWGHDSCAQNGCTGEDD